MNAKVDSWEQFWNAIASMFDGPHDYWKEETEDWLEARDDITYLPESVYEELVF